MSRGDEGSVLYMFSIQVLLSSVLWMQLFNDDARH